MKKVLAMIMLALLLTGCGRNVTLETVTDVPDTLVVAPVQRVLLHLPEELSAPALQNEETGALYLCDDYSLALQTVSSGDLKKTIHEATGIQMENLEILQTGYGNIKRYQWVWTATGETGIQVGRGCILDDGTYHYVLTALADETVSGKVQPVWKEIFTSFGLSAEREEVSSGS